MRAAIAGVWNLQAAECPPFAIRANNCGSVIRLTSLAPYQDQALLKYSLSAADVH
jgi:colanic acid biosynthesis glycosyl transferase WcaI